MSTPSITPAQIVGYLTAIGGPAIAFGLLSDAQEKIVIAAITAAVGLTLKIADAIIRHGRSRSLNGARAAAINREADLAAITAATPEPPAAEPPSAP